MISFLLTQYAALSAQCPRGTSSKKYDAAATRALFCHACAPTMLSVVLPSLWLVGSVSVHGPHFCCFTGFRLRTVSPGPSGDHDGYAEDIRVSCWWFVPSGVHNPDTCLPSPIPGVRYLLSVARPRRSPTLYA